MRTVCIIAFLMLNLYGQQSTIESLFKNVLVKNVKLSLKTTEHLQKNLEKNPLNIKDVREDFKTLVYQWKNIQATYIGGDLDEDLLDLPRFIDIYHEGNENIHKQLFRVQKSTDSLDIELFKNSYKTINALEYILFSNTALTKRDIQIATRINQNIHKHLKDLLRVYTSDLKKILSDEKFVNSAILNALVASSYKTSSWRLAEGLGKSKKYNKIDPKRFEYSFSKQSITALKGIFGAHQEIMNGKYEDFGDMASENGAKDEVTTIRKLLKEILTLLNGMKEKDLVGKKGKILYDKAKTLYLTYGLYMLDALEVTAKIVEADGD